MNPLELALRRVATDLDEAGVGELLDEQTPNLVALGWVRNCVSEEFVGAGKRHFLPRAFEARAVGKGQAHIFQMDAPLPDRDAADPSGRPTQVEASRHPG